jgi:protein phosphatase 1D
MVLTSSVNGFSRAATTSSASTINSTNLQSPGNMIVNMRVTANSGQGHRKYMEDCYKIRFQRDTTATANTDTNNNKNGGAEKSGNPQSDILFSYFGIFDGHGGKEAAQYCKEKLFWAIIESDDFWSDSDAKILGAIRQGFVKCHLDMWDELPQWPKTASGLSSTSGTTATVLFIKKSKAYVGHVGDSGLVIGYTKSMTSKASTLNTPWYGKKLTRDHKPEDPIELKRIQSLGGSVMTKSGVNRVVWNRPVLSGINSSSNLQNVNSFLFEN